MRLSIRLAISCRCARRFACETDGPGVTTRPNWETYRRRTLRAKLRKPRHTGAVGRPTSCGGDLWQTNRVRSRTSAAESFMVRSCAQLKDWDARRADTPEANGQSNTRVHRN